MDIFSLASLLALGVSLFLAYVVYFRNPKAAVNRVFSILCLLQAYSAFAELGLRQANGLDSARLWLKAGSFWPLSLAALLHFSLVFARGPRWLRNKLAWVLIYISALAISLADLFTDYITGEPVEKFWGWTYQVESNLVLELALYWTAIIIIPAAYLCWRTFFKTDEVQRKNQAKYVAIGVSFPIIFGLCSNMLLPIFDVRLPEGVSFPFAIGSAFIGYGIWRHGLFDINVKTVAYNIISMISDSLFLVNEQGRIMTVSASALKSLGYTEEELRGSELGALFLEKDEDMPLTEVEGALLASMVRASMQQAHEMTLVTKAGKHIPVSVVTSAINAKDGSLQGFVCIVRDMTWYKETQDKLLTSYEREKELRKNLEGEISRRIEFTRALVHELKTPLTPMMASSHLLAEEVEGETLQRLAKNIGEGAQALNMRIDELLDVAKGELGMLQLKLNKADISSLVNTLVEDMTPMASSRGQSLILDTPSPLPLIMVDENRLRQVMLNLLNNAFKFTPDGGKIILRAKMRTDSLVVEVQDTGRGISEEEQEYLFNPYYRVESDRQRFSGMGLGLALCKTLVELHGGRIWVESEVGRGSTFAFSIPIHSGVAGQSDVV